MKIRRPLLRHPGDRRTLGLLAALTGSYTVSMLGQVWWLLPLSLVLVVTACCAKHNHVHCAVFRSHWLNRVLNLWLSLLTGFSTTGIRVSHQVRHHGKSQSAVDFVRCALVDGLPAGRALLCYVPRVAAETWRHSRRDLDGKKRAGLRRALLAERITLWCFLAAMLAWRPMPFLLFMGVPWLFGQWFLIAMNLPQHDGCDEASPWDHSRNVTGPWENWLFLNNGFHTAHHEKPGLHWSRLPAWHHAEAAPRMSPRLNQPTLFSFWKAWWTQRR